jgi:hypothetical protein
MGPEFYNLYVENLIKELGESLKIKVILQTQLELQQKITAELQQRLEKYEKAEERPAKKAKKDDSTF